MHRFKADLFRLIKTKRYLTPLSICILMCIFFTYISNNIKENSDIIAINNLTAFILFFFITPVAFFWGDDYSYRTINNILIKEKSRLNIFLYKTFMTLLTSLLFVFISYIIMIITRALFGNSSDVITILKMLFYQLPYYTYIIMLLLLFFHFFQKASYAYGVYILTVMLLDSLLNLVFFMILKIDLILDFLMFFRIQNINIKEPFFNTSSIIAILLSIVFFTISYYLFNKREFK